MVSKPKRNFYTAALVITAVISVIAAFVVFIWGNYNRAMSISINSLKDATTQSANRIDDVMANAKNEIILMADLYEEMLNSPDVTVEDLCTLEEKSDYDYIDFVNTDGVDLNQTGETVDVSDRDYFKDAMNGNSGVTAVFDSRFTGETLIIFYTPLYYNDSQIGVLLGHYTEQKMSSILANTFFGEDSRTFLCNRDGIIIACGDNIHSSMSLFDEDIFHAPLNTDVEASLKSALLANSEYEFQYEGTKGTGNAYVTPLTQSDWLFIQTFPSQVTSQFVSDANTAGVILLAELVGISVVCFVIVQIANSIQKKRLIAENKEKSYVVNGITQLFGSFVLVDLEKESYQYLANSKPRQNLIALSGPYEPWRKYVSDLLYKEEERTQLYALLGLNKLRSQLNEETPYLCFEHQIQADEETWDSLNMICLERVDGLPTKILFTYQDVTRVKKRELQSYKALQEAYQAVDSANQAKSSFLSNMSHDIRTPMNAIMGMTAIAAMHINNPDRVKDCLNKITLSSQHLLSLINEVLDMSKIESGKMIFAEEEFSLSDVVERTISIFLPQTEANKQNFRVNIANIVHEEVIGDSMRLQQIFVNILGNSVKFTPEGGDITVTIYEKPSGMNGCGRYEFIFEDTGIGMESDFLDHLFEPFSRATDSRISKIEGTGLGMPIVKNIVALMNGEIEVESKLNEGTKFTVTVYLKLNHSKHDDVSGLKDLTVLVADDDRFSCESACSILDEIGMVSDWVLTGDEAIAKIGKAHEDCKDYAAVILDWKMPDKDGIQTAREIRKLVGDDVPIIILSAFDYSSIEQEAREAGINAFIAKPLFRSRLVYVMKSLMLEKPEETSDMDILHSKDYSGKRVLLVEDNEINMEIAVELLGQTGISVDTAENGQVALTRVTQTPPGYYDLIFMDIQMPVMNGYEATAAIRASGREDLKTIPIVAMSADVFMDDVKHAQDSGMNGHVGKPVKIEALVNTLENWIS
jgi:signal transduction histidine kinase/DNA-binding response OmpR family regulator